MPKPLMIIVFGAIVLTALGIGVVIFKAATDTDLPSSEPGAQTGAGDVQAGDATALTRHRESSRSSDASVSPPEALASDPAAEDVTQMPKGPILTASDSRINRRERRKYSLPSSLMAKRLSGTADPTLRLTEAQAKEVKAIEEEMAVDVGNSLSDEWLRRDWLKIRMKHFSEKKRWDELSRAEKLYQKTFNDERDIRTRLDDKYRKQFAEILTDEQMQCLTGPITEELRIRIYGEPIEEPAGMTDGQSTDPAQLRLRAIDVGNPSQLDR